MSIPTDFEALLIMLCHWHTCLSHLFGPNCSLANQGHALTLALAKKQGIFLLSPDFPMHQLPSILWVVTHSVHTFFMVSMVEQSFGDTKIYQCPCSVVIADMDITNLICATTKRQCTLPPFLWPLHASITPAPAPANVSGTTLPSTHRDPACSTKCDYTNLTAPTNINTHQQNPAHHPLLKTLWDSISAHSWKWQLYNVMDTARKVKDDNLHKALGNLNKNTCLLSIIAGDCMGGCSLDHTTDQVSNAQAQLVSNMLQLGIVKLAKGSS